MTHDHAVALREDVRAASGCSAARAARTSRQLHEDERADAALAQGQAARWVAPWASGGLRRMALALWGFARGRGRWWPSGHQAGCCVGVRACTLGLCVRLRGHDASSLRV